MPLFGRNTAETAPAVPEKTTVETNRRSNLFGRRRESSPTNAAMTNTNTSSHHGLLHRNVEDASITSARERVLVAEAAERDADKALLNARAAVRQAREHVKRIEREAAEESVALPHIS